MKKKYRSWHIYSMLGFSSQLGKSLFLLLASLFLFQVPSTDCWTFPRQKVRLTLPEDYPIDIPFYKVSVVPTKKDVVKNTTIDYSMKVVLFRKGSGETSALKKGVFVELEQRTGFLKLKRKLDLSFIRGRKRHRVYANITITGFSKNDKKIRKFDILLEVADTLENYCIPKLTTCFPTKKYEYDIPEDSQNNATLDFIMNPGLQFVCPELTVKYDVLSEHNSFAINSSTGALRFTSEIDADEITFQSFEMRCMIGNEVYSVPGSIRFDDINDNAPVTQSGNSTEEMVFYIKPDQAFLNFAVSAFDRDSKHLNKVEVKTANDTLNLFDVQPLKQYENIHKQNYTFLYADIHSKDMLAHDFTEYNFSVVLEDKGLTENDGKVIFHIHIIREKLDNFQIKDAYEVNISRKASEFSRVFQISPISLNNTRFKLANWLINKDWLNITEKSGIVFIRDPLLMPDKTTEQRKITWSRKNATHEESGTSILVINIDGEEPPGTCGSKSWCSFYASGESCIQNCGKGAVTGTCSWRQEPYSLHPSNSPTILYSACSPDLTTCPDGRCDELESLEPSICPLDCAKEITGTAIRSLGAKGVQKARGVCYCSATDICNCSPPPQELKIYQVKEVSNHSFIEIRNLTVLDAGKQFKQNDETSTSKEIIPISGFFIDGNCGIGCILFVAIAPCAVIFVIVTVYAVKKMRSDHITHLKAAGSRISLSAVPSDYVQERTNSAQDTRSDSSNLEKTVLDPKWEFPRNRLQFQTILGEGEFGKVVKAQASNITGTKGLTTVAVKMLKENGGMEEMQDLISEFTLLKDISHPNVIRLLGACTDKGGPFYLIVEYAEMGSLRSYLRRRRKHNNCFKYNVTYGITDFNTHLPTEADIQFVCERSRYEPRHCFFHKEQMSYAWQVAKGMAYLADMKLVHRDLAARNILLTKRKVVKISDFGLSRDIYKGEAYLKKTKGRVPVKWLAIESLEDQIYTTRSDVWSFGIVLWEIMTQGATPYPGVTPQRLYNLLKAGYRMGKPDNCPDELYAIMRQCWKKVPNERPCFRELVVKLDDLLQDTVEYMDFERNLFQPRQRVNDKPLISFEEPTTSTLNYTSVFMEYDEERTEPESPENIGLVNLFSESDTKLLSDQESIT